jgi:hypothetical protein
VSGSCYCPGQGGGWGGQEVILSLAAWPDVPAPQSSRLPSRSLTLTRMAASATGSWVTA